VNGGLAEGAGFAAGAAAKGECAVDQEAPAERARGVHVNGGRASSAPFVLGANEQIGDRAATRPGEEPRGLYAITSRRACSPRNPCARSLRNQIRANETSSARRFA